MEPTQGIHHITAFAKRPQVNADFYHKVLGQRLVKTTVNFDDPGTYHLYYGDNQGTPGTILTFFPLPYAARGERGSGEVVATAYIIPEGAVSYWQERLEASGVVDAVRLDERFGQRALIFEDPDGMVLELVGSDQPSQITHWAEGPVPEAFALRGFHSATLQVERLEPTAAILTEQLGYTRVGQEGARTRFQAGAEDRGMFIDVVERPGAPRGRTGAGTVHHIAFRTAHDDEQEEYLQKLRAAQIGVTPVKDRQYFRSIYFREPNGVLFEIATDAPGFDADEEIAELGRLLKLPSWYEPMRDQIEARLPELTYPEL